MVNVSLKKGFYRLIFEFFSTCFLENGENWPKSEKLRGVIGL